MDFLIGRLESIIEDYHIEAKGDCINCLLSTEGAYADDVCTILDKTIQRLKLERETMKSEKGV